MESNFSKNLVNQLWVGEVKLNETLHQEPFNIFLELWDESEEVNVLLAIWSDVVQDKVEGTLECSGHESSDIIWNSLDGLNTVDKFSLEEVLELLNNSYLGSFWDSEFPEEWWEPVEVWTSFGSQFLLDSEYNLLNCFFISQNTWQVLFHVFGDLLEDIEADLLNVWEFVSGVEEFVNGTHV